MTSENIYLLYTEAKGNQKMDKRGTKGVAIQYRSQSVWYGSLFLWGTSLR